MVCYDKDEYYLEYTFRDKYGNEIKLVGKDKELKFKVGLCYVLELGKISNTFNVFKINKALYCTTTGEIINMNFHT